jgi:hypothetical protein
MKQNNRFTGRRIAAGASLAALAAFGSLALAPAAFADSTVASVPAHTAQLQPNGYGDCISTLQGFGYTIEPERATSCFIASLGPKFIPSCVLGMKSTRVGIIAASAACIAGAY